MSRTDKDRPWRIKAMDPSVPRKAYHNHELFGKKVERYVRTGKVERVLIEYGEPVWILRDKHDKPGMNHEEWLGALSWWERRRWNTLDVVPCRNHLRWYYEKRVRFEYTNRTIETVYYADHCTVDEPDGPLQTCGYWTRYRNEAVGESRTDWVNLAHTRPERQRERMSMHNLRDEYNTFGDVDDSQWQDFQSRRTWWH